MQDTKNQDRIHILKACFWLSFSTLTVTLIQLKTDDHGVKIFFLSVRNSCRSQMAESILRSLDGDLEIFSAGIDPVDHVSPIAMEVMAEVGIDLQQSVPKHYKEFLHEEFDYLITVGESTQEELDVPDIRYRRKLHLGVHSPYKNARSHDEIKTNCREVRDELMSELDYFYYRIIKKSVC